MIHRSPFPTVAVPDLALPAFILDAARGHGARPAFIDAGTGRALTFADVACIDDEDYVFIVDRIKELIKYKGWQVAPADLEALLLTHPAVADAAVIPSPDPEAGEVPKAFVVARDPVSADAIMAYVAARVAPYERVRRVEFVDAIPKSPSGKILRRVLVERERAVRAAAG